LARWSLRFLNGLISLAVSVVLLMTALYAGFALWDNHRIYEEADTVFDEMRAIKARFAESRSAKDVQAAALTAAPVVQQSSSDLTITAKGVSGSIAETSVVQAAAPTAVPVVQQSSSGLTVTAKDVSGSIAEASVVHSATPTAEPVVQQSSSGLTVTAKGVSGSIAEASVVHSAAPTAVPVVQQSSSGLTVTAKGVSGSIAEAPRTEALPAVTAEPVLEPAYEAYGAPFDELIAINPDVNGWLTMPGTAIDHPLVQGKNNLDYISKNVYGEFALMGSIFLDSRNDHDYRDLYSILYGHNMSKHRMFGDVNLYKDEVFFRENQTGQLFLRDREHTLQTISCIVTPASNSTIFNPDNWLHMTNEEMLQAVQTEALFVSEEGLAALRQKLDSGEQPRILALSTCSNEYTDARTILLTLIDPEG